MKNFTLLFLFVPAVLAFASNGGDWPVWMFRGLILAWLFAEIIPALYQRAIRQSEAEIYVGYGVSYIKAIFRNDYAAANDAQLAKRLFENRGVRA